MHVDRNNPLRIFAAHEVAAFCDPSMATKMTVQFNLFGGTVLKLGTRTHHDALLRGMDTLDDVGETVKTLLIILKYVILLGDL